MNIYEKLELLQQEYKSPKSEYNSHGGFKYRTLEKMEEVFKPLAKEHKVLLRFSDRTVECAGVPHIEADAILVNLENPEEQIISTASAQEAGIQKGMQAAQISGSTSSYARKYAMSALLLVDDTQELDSKKGNQTDTKAVKGAVSLLEQSESLEELKDTYMKLGTLMKDKAVIEAKDKMKAKLSKVAA